MNKPKLIDYSLFKKSIPKTIKIITPTDNSLLINIISILILLIGGLYLYHRFLEKDQNDINNQTMILGLYQYVKDNIK